MTAYVSLSCDGKDTRYGEDCPVSDTGPGLPRTATQARKLLARIGWHRTRDGRDICPDCWAEGQR